MEVFQEFTVEAAHHLTNVTPGLPCGGMHGHAYRIEVHVSGDVDPQAGWVLDYAVIREAWNELCPQLDHRVLNDVQGLENPTSENLARWIWDRLKPTLTGLSRVVVRESSATGCVYRGEPC